MPRHWQVLLMAALGIGATVIAVPRALSGIVAIPQVAEAGISRTGAATPSSRPSTAKMPVWSAPASKATSPDTRPPSGVTGLRLLVNTETTIGLAWNASQDNVAVKLYVVKGDGFTTVQTTETKATVSWPHRTGSVTVQVAAVDTSWNQGEWRSLVVSAPVSTAAVTTAAPAPPVTNTNPVVTTTAPQPSTQPPSTEPPSTASTLAAPDATAVQTAAVQPSNATAATSSV